MSNKHVSELVGAAKRLNWLNQQQVVEIEALLASDTLSDPDTLLVERGFLSREQIASLKRSRPPRTVPGQFGRFRVTASHAQGGLGEVFKAEDQELHREVALKQLKHRFAGNPELRNRFLMEAELTGSLEHPGIVPVYGLGVGKQGIPYYAMRFIRGKSLREAVKDFHQGTTGDAPSTRHIAFRKLLANFVSVCQTMHFAHSRGILHRDIKPDNIMIGEFGETMVVDWGIAKVTGRRGADLISELETLTPESQPASQTRAGSVIGTPGFMSPEQSLGWTDSLTPASDIYSLGATLFFLLTGQYCFGKESTIEEIIASTCGGNIRTPLQANPRVSKPLDAICRKALATKPSQRYATAQNLADDIEAYLADEPISAWQEPLLARISRVFRRYRTAVTMAGLTLLVVTGISIASAILINHQRNRAERSRVQAERLAEEKRQLAEAESVARAEAESKRQEADAARSEAERTLDFLVQAFRSPDPERDGRQITVAEVLDRAVTEIPETLKENPLQQATLLYSIGETYLGLGIYEGLLTLAQQAHDIRLRELGPDHLDTSDTWSLLGLVYTELGEPEKAIEHHQQSLKIRQTQHGETHLDVLITQNNIANALMSMGRDEQATRLYEHCYQHLKQQFGEENFNTLLVMGNLSVLYRSLGRLPEARQLGEKVYEVRTARFGENSFGSMLAASNLVDVYREMGESKRGMQLAQTVFDLQHSNLGGDHPETIRSAIRLAESKSAAGQLQETIQILTPTIENIVSRYGKKHEIWFQARETQAIAYARLGQVDRAAEIFESLVASCRDELGDEHPSTFRIMMNSAVTLDRAGKYRESADIQQQLLTIGSGLFADNHPRILTLKNNLAHQQLTLGDTGDAIRLFRECLAGWRELGTESRATAISAEGLSHALLTARDFPALESAARAALQIAPKFQEADPAIVARSQTMLAVALAQQGKLEEAQKEVDQVTAFFATRRFQPHMMAYAQCVAGLVKLRQGDLSQAQDLFEEFLPDLIAGNETAPRYYGYQLLHAYEYQIELSEALDLPDQAAHWRNELERQRSSYQ